MTKRSNVDFSMKFDEVLIGKGTKRNALVSHVKNADYHTLDASGFTKDGYEFYTVTIYIKDKK